LTQLHCKVRNEEPAILYFRDAQSRIRVESAECLQGAGPQGKSRRMTAKVTVEDVERVAELANLELAPEESAHMLHDLNVILDYVEELSELDTTGVVPLAQVTELFSAPGAGGLRPDQNVPSLDRATVLAQSPETDQVFFKVPKVIER